MNINVQGTLIDLSEPKVMGVLNLTPDSFYDGGSYQDLEAAIAQTARMLEEGATFIDVGAYSSRPGAQNISAAAEEARLTPVLAELVRTFPQMIISVDTFRASVAKKAIEAGASIVNDISAGMLDSEMMKTVGILGVPYIMMHMQGTPQTMQNATEYGVITKEVAMYFSERINQARKYKIKDLIVDPGYGFAKTPGQSLELLGKSDFFQNLELPVLTGISRKSMIYKTLETKPSEALNGTTALHMVALQKGSSILRVHDVKPAMECIKLCRSLS